MAVTPAKENILKRIRQALSNPVPLPFPQSEGTNSVFLPAADDLEVLFAQEFTNLQGKFAFCVNEEDMLKQVQQLIAAKEWTKIYCNTGKWKDPFSNTINLAGCDASITGCEYLVARTGTIVMSAAQQSGRTVSVYAPVHICIAYTSQLVYDVKDALQFIKEKYAGNIPSLITFATGPSRTADIEKTLVTGVHGPKEVYCFLVEA
ncbi:MAG: LUD domain-containing protein [Ferruginibacter sp.]|nr:LUD domain-containing protein [Chitinophagaceae bacterium]MBP6285888.1 LUD domain-containing protein [Ferruginibacter sp.]MBU9936045.1 LUD domain-containing protein [Ferruginibacter sp.]HQY11041.1 LUD domain-containing protein [Ferruginibacter sp.]